VAGALCAVCALVELLELAQLPDASIDYSDIPPLPEEFWLNAVRNPFFRPTKPIPRCASIPM
jgi:hypothetical protein